MMETRRVVGAAMAAVAVWAASGTAWATTLGAPMTPGTTGADISWPQCTNSDTATAEPGGAFTIVGVNGGLANDENPCLSPQLTYASGATYSEVQVYLNTADPGNTVADWPTSNPPGITATPYGSCTTVKSRGQMVGADSQACAWAYGYERATQDIAWLDQATSTAPVAWWLDVETGNTWQSRKNLDMNGADLTGMVDALPAATVGAYSTSYQWGKIVGTSSFPALASLPEWIPSGLSSADTSYCPGGKNALQTFTSGGVQYVQYTTTYDYDVAC